MTRQATKQEVLDFTKMQNTTEQKGNVVKPLTIAEQIANLPAKQKLKIRVDVKRDLDKGVQLVGVGKQTVEFKAGEEVELPVWAIKLITDEDACFYIEHVATGDKRRPTKSVRRGKYTVTFL